MSRHIPARECAECGRTFRGTNRLCPACRATERECAGCGRAFRSSNARCSSCALRAMPAEARAAYLRARGNRRRARKRAAAPAGPISAAVYAAVLASGPCVYCGAVAATVDHVRPLARGGAEAADNLAPACHSCNASKCDRLLTEWRRAELVACAVSVSSVVAAEWQRLALADCTHGREVAS